MRLRLVSSAALLTAFLIPSLAHALPPSPTSDCEYCSGRGGNRFCRQTNSTDGYKSCQEDYYGNCIVGETCLASYRE